MRLKKTWPEVVGWIGVASILLAYILNTFGILEPEDRAYLFLNLVGAIGIIIDAYKDKNYQPVVLNTIWAVVALIGLVQSVLFFTT